MFYKCWPCHTLLPCYHDCQVANGQKFQSKQLTWKHCQKDVEHIRVGEMSKVFCKWTVVVFIEIEKDGAAIIAMVPNWSVLFNYCASLTSLPWPGDIGPPPVQHQFNI